MVEADGGWPLYKFFLILEPALGEWAHNVYYVKFGSGVFGLLPFWLPATLYFPFTQYRQRAWWCCVCGQYTFIRLYLGLTTGDYLCIHAHIS